MTAAHSDQTNSEAAPPITYHHPVSAYMIRLMHTSRLLRSNAVVVPAAPVRKIGAVRGGFTGFLFGVSLTGAAAYYYLFDQYQAGQQAILSDVITLRQSLEELQGTVTSLKKECESAGKKQ